MSSNIEKIKTDIEIKLSKDKYGQFELYTNKNLIKNPVISVVMSVYNGGKLLIDAIDSILNQTYKNIELIIINDGSTDDTLKILKKYNMEDSRVVIINQNNIGLTKSLNRGLIVSRGTFIARQDADDISTEKRLEIQLNWISNEGYDFCCSRTYIVQLDKIVPSIYSYLARRIIILWKNVYIHGTFFSTKDFFTKIGGYDDTYVFAQDYRLVREILKRKYKIKYIKDVLYISNKMEGCISNVKKKDQLEYFRKGKKYSKGVHN